MKAASLVLAAGLLLSGGNVLPATLPGVVPNDNRVPAGRLRGDTLDLDLEVRMATWYLEADSGPAVEVAAFAETAVEVVPQRSGEFPFSCGMNMLHGSIEVVD